MKSILLPAILASFISPGSEPQTKPASMPEKCPEAQAIASVAIDYVAAFPWFHSQKTFVWTGVVENAAYDTNDTWTTLVFDPKETGTKGRAILQQLTSGMGSLEALGENVPHWGRDLGVWICAYYNKNAQVYAITVNPSLYVD